MSTVTEEIAKQLIANDGIYPGDPQCYAVLSYNNQYGGQSWAVCYSKNDFNNYAPSPYVRKPKVQWSSPSLIIDISEALVKLHAGVHATMGVCIIHDIDIKEVAKVAFEDLTPELDDNTLDQAIALAATEENNV